MRWVKIRSWHLVGSVSRADRPLKTLCGRTLSGTEEVTDDFGDGKTCESCLRIEAK